MSLDLLLIALGLALLAAGGEAMVRGAASLALRLRVAPAVVGLTVVAVGTSLPELVVSIRAAFAGSPDLAVGNVVGSNFYNVALILGVAALIRPLRIEGRTVGLEWRVMVAATLLLLALGFDRQLARWEGAVLVAGLALFITWTVRQAGRVVPAVDAQLGVEAVPTGRSWAVSVVLVVLGCGLLGFGGGALVRGAVGLAAAYGVSERVIGLTVVAVGTSLPELFASAVASVRGHDDIAVANVIGSNIFNVLGILGASAVVRPVPVHPAIVARDLPWALGAAVVLLPLMWPHMRLQRWKGALLLAAAAAYTGTLLAF